MYQGPFKVAQGRTKVGIGRLGRIAQSRIKVRSAHPKLFCGRGLGLMRMPRAEAECRTIAAKC